MMMMDVKRIGICEKKGKKRLGLKKRGRNKVEEKMMRKKKKRKKYEKI